MGDTERELKILLCVTTPNYKFYLIKRKPMPDRVLAECQGDTSVTDVSSVSLELFWLPNNS